MASKKLLIETLNQLSPEEFDEFKFLIKEEKGLRFVSKSQLQTANTQDVVDLMVEMDIHTESVEVTRKALRKMNRTDLVQRLAAGTTVSSFDSTKFSFKQVETMMTKKLIIETLNQLSPEEFDEFKSLIEEEKGLPLISKSRLQTANTQDVVELMMENYSRECEEVTRKTLMKINRTDLVHRLSGIISASKEKQFPPLTQRVETMASLIELLLETLADLTDKEFENFRVVLCRNTYLDVSWRLLGVADLQDTVFVMMQIYGQQSMDKTMEVLKEMRRTDLAERLRGSSSEPKKKHLDEHLSALIHKTATMAAVKELLLETLEDLSYRDFQKFKWFLQFTCFQKSLPQISVIALQNPIRADILDELLEMCGLQCMEVIREVFSDMNRPDLVQRLSESSSGVKAAGSSAEGFGVKETDGEKHSVREYCPALMQKVEMMASVIELLLETLDDLSFKEHSEFMRVLNKFLHHKHNSYILWRMLLEQDLQLTVFVMVQTYGQQSVDITTEVLKKMKRTDLAERLTDCSSEPTKKLSVDERRAALIQKVATVAAVKHLLLETLDNLSFEELKDFKKFMESVFPSKNLPYISPRLSQSSYRTEIVDLMVEKLGQRSVEVTRKILMDMNRTDLMQKLSETSSGSREKQFVDEQLSVQMQKTLTVQSDRERLLGMLDDLTLEEFETFKWFLGRSNVVASLPTIPKNTLAKADKVYLVDLMLQMYTQQSVEVTEEVFKKMNRTDLAEGLSDISSGSKGQEAFRSSELEGCGRMTQDSSDWTKLEPEVNSIDADKAPTYSLQSEAGHFECSVSGLRWICKEKSSFQYQFSSWEGHMERMESRQYMPAGPLMDVKITAGKLNEVHLPHWICIDDIPDVLDKFAVLHTNNCGDVVEKVSEVTPSHVKLKEPSFSLVAALISFFFPLKFSCYMLIYYQPNTPFLKLRIYPVRQDPALEERIHKEESSEGFKRIRKPHPDGYLPILRAFSLRADAESAEIQPKELTFRYNSLNFYEVFIENPGRKLNLTLLHTVDGEPQHEPVWTCKINKGDHPTSGYDEGKYSTDKRTSARPKKAFFKSDKKKHCEVMEHLTEEEFKRFLGDSDEPNTLTIRSGREKLLGMLECLKQEEFERFKWFLKDSDVLEQLQPIPEGRLEKVNRCNLVDLMLQTYAQQTVEVTKKILKKMNRNDLVRKLSDIS